MEDPALKSKLWEQMYNEEKLAKERMKQMFHEQRHISEQYTEHINKLNDRYRQEQAQLLAYKKKLQKKTKELDSHMDSSEIQGNEMQQQVSKLSRQYEQERLKAIELKKQLKEEKSKNKKSLQHEKKKLQDERKKLEDARIRINDGISKHDEEEVGALKIKLDEEQSKVEAAQSKLEEAKTRFKIALKEKDAALEKQKAQFSTSQQALEVERQELEKQVARSFKKNAWSNAAHSKQKKQQPNSLNDPEEALSLLQKSLEGFSNVGGLSNLQLEKLSQVSDRLRQSVAEEQKQRNRAKNPTKNVDPSGSRASDTKQVKQQGKQQVEEEEKAVEGTAGWKTVASEEQKTENPAALKNAFESMGVIIFRITSPDPVTNTVFECRIARSLRNPFPNKMSSTSLTLLLKSGRLE